MCANRVGTQTHCLRVRRLTVVFESWFLRPTCYHNGQQPQSGARDFLLLNACFWLNIATQKKIAQKKTRFIFCGRWLRDHMQILLFGDDSNNRCWTILIEKREWRATISLIEFFCGLAARWSGCKAYVCLCIFDFVEFNLRCANTLCIFSRGALRWIRV